MARGALVAGARVRIRDAEWVVGHVEKNSVAGSIIHATGISGIVRDKNAIFVESVERTRGRGIEVIDPANVVLVPDQSSGFSDTLLHLEAALRKSAPTGLAPQVARKAAIDDLDFQLDPVRLALRAPRVRVLIGDDVGLGKTLEAGLLASELILRRRARRILVVTTKAMLTQFQQEFWTRFSIPLVRIDSAKIKQIRARIPLNQNPFDQFEKTIISIDTLKNDDQYRVSLEKSWWDLIVIDEAHNVAERGGPRAVSQRNVLAERLASRSDALVLLSATPHDGSRRSFASLMRMLDPTSIADPDHYGPDDIKGLFLRRFRTTPAVKDALKSKVKARTTSKLDLKPSAQEEALYEGLATLALREDASRKKGQRLFKTLLEKSLFSSPEAFLETLGKRVAALEENKDEDSVPDATALSALVPLARAIDEHAFTKYQRLLTLLKDDLKWKASKKDDRLVIFSERIATLEWLANRLRHDLGLDERQVVTLHASGAGADVKAQEIVEDFGIEKKPIRILLASDMASEGLNLHYLSHKLVHFDIPWALLKFQQRNGRIDRYGQERTPMVWYLVAHPQQDKIRGDLRIAYDFLTALGYDRNFRLLWDGEEKLVPVEATRVDASGHDRVWVVETIAPAGVDFNADPLTTRFRCEQFENIDAATDIAKRRKDAPEAALNKGIFALKHPPRFVIIMSMSQVVLVDREKWGDSRLLRFDLAEIFGRNEPSTIGTVAALLHASSLAPESGTALLDRIDEESHRHAYGVSQDLKFALRKAIELLGNEAAELIVEKRRAQQKGVFTGAQALDAAVLTTECLRYMYRLLFLFYIEARPDLGFAPINAAAYTSG